MIVNESEYRRWITARGVGAKDQVASSQDSYVSYLNSVSECLGRDISPELIASEEDVLRIARQIEGARSDGTIRNYKSAMRQYVAMVTSGVVDPPVRANTSEPNESPGRHVEPLGATEHNLYSSYREMLLEHLFSGEVLRHLWLRGNTRIEVLKPQVDDAGYDLVLEANGVVRHVQLKSSHAGSSTAEVKVGLALAKKPSGCVIWLWFDPKTLSLGPFLWFGGAPGSPLPDLSAFKVAKHTKGNALGVKLERPGIRVVPKNQFQPIGSVPNLCTKLFGVLRESAAG